MPIYVCVNVLILLSFDMAAGHGRQGDEIQGNSPPSAAVSCSPSVLTILISIFMFYSIPSPRDDDDDGPHPFHNTTPTTM